MSSVIGSFVCPPVSELMSLTNRTLTATYHKLQLLYVGAVAHGDLITARDMLHTAIVCREIVMSRFGDAESGHVRWYEQLVGEIVNISHVIGLRTIGIPADMIISLPTLITDYNASLMRV